MGAAPMAYTLFRHHINCDPTNPKWANRDRFVLSAGHGCMLQYSLLHLLGYQLSIDDLKNFRQFGSKTPGHPENFETPGVEVTTGPLGQGIANAVGLAAAEAHLAARFNVPGEAPLVDHYTYCILGDGCMMEGISSEAASLAGHWGLGKLIALYDDNKISIDGDTSIAFTEDVSARFRAQNWHVLDVLDGNLDLKAIEKAIEQAKAVTDRPTLINVRTTIGYGSPNKAGSHDVHGSALGADEAAATRKALAWPHAEFEVPREAYEEFHAAADRGRRLQKEWEKLRAAYAQRHPELYAEWECIQSGALPARWEEALPIAKLEDKPLATRLHSQTMLNALAPALPGLLGGSADLAGSCMTLLKKEKDFQKTSYEGRNVRFGVREHAMGAVGNGLAHYAPGMLPYTATFFVFTDYMRASIRLAALSRAGQLFVMTHDSVGLGEDGPTHQPVEHLASLRALPDLLVMRPADGVETAAAYAAAVRNAAGNNPVKRKRPSVLVLSRQTVPNLEHADFKKAQRGAYAVSGPETKTPDVVLMATGTEVGIALEAAKKLAAQGVAARVVSMPCWELFAEQDAAYREQVLPARVKARVSVEAGSTFGWDRFLGERGRAVGIDRFGASAPGPVCYQELGMSAQHVVEQALASIRDAQRA